MQSGFQSLVLVFIVALIGLILSSQETPTAYAVCAPGEWVEWGITAQGMPYRECGPVRPVNYTSTYIRIRGSF